MSKKIATEEIVRSYFADHETWGIEGAYLKHMDDNCVIRYNEYPELAGISAIMEKVKRFNRIFKRPYARIIIKTVSTDTEHNNAFLVEYEVYPFNKVTGDTIKIPKMSAFETNEKGKIIRVTEAFDTTELQYGDAMPGKF